MTFFEKIYAVFWFSYRSVLHSILRQKSLEPPPTFSKNINLPKTLKYIIRSSHSRYVKKVKRLLPISRDKIKVNKKIIIFCVFLSIAMFGFGSDIYLANLYVYSEAGLEITIDEKNCTDFLYEYLSIYDFNKKLPLKKIGSRYTEIIKSIFEAESAALSLGIDYIIYGHINKTDDYYSMSVNLYNSKSKQIISTVYGKEDIKSQDELDSLLPLLKDMSEKINREIGRAFGLPEVIEEEVVQESGSSEVQEEKKKNEKKEIREKNRIARTEKRREIGEGIKKEWTGREAYQYFEYIKLYNAVGYHIPFPRYWDGMTGIVNGETGFYIGLIPICRFNKNILMQTQFGFTFGYVFSLNKPQIIESYFHSFLYKFPVDLLFEFYKRVGVSVEVGPQVQFDFLCRKELYHDDYYVRTVSFSLFVALASEIMLGDKRQFAVGIKNIFDFTFYRDFYSDYKVEVYFTNKIFF